jgi:hypothetical protein
MAVFFLSCLRIDADDTGCGDGGSFKPMMPRSGGGAGEDDETDRDGDGGGEGVEEEGEGDACDTDGEGARRPGLLTGMVGIGECMRAERLVPSVLICNVRRGAGVEAASEVGVTTMRGVVRQACCEVGLLVAPRIDKGNGSAAAEVAPLLLLLLPVSGVRGKRISDAPDAVAAASCTLMVMRAGTSTRLVDERDACTPAAAAAARGEPDTCRLCARRKGLLSLDAAAAPTFPRAPPAAVVAANNGVVGDDRRSCGFIALDFASSSSIVRAEDDVVITRWGDSMTGGSNNVEPVDLAIDTAAAGPNSSAGTERGTVTGAAEGEAVCELEPECERWLRDGREGESSDGRDTLRSPRPFADNPATDSKPEGEWLGMREGETRGDDGMLLWLLLLLCCCSHGVPAAIEDPDTERGSEDCFLAPMIAPRTMVPLGDDSTAGGASTVAATVAAAIAATATVPALLIACVVSSSGSTDGASLRLPSM